MGEIPCSYCPKSAEFICKCASKPNYVCSTHTSDHLRLIGKHDLKQYGPIMISFNPEIRSNLLKKIIDIKTKASKDIEKALKHLNDAVTIITSKFTQFSAYMTRFIESCDDMATNIIKMPNSIMEKKYYTPLEALLTMQEPEVLNHIFGPEIVLHKIQEKIVEYSISSFPNCLFEYFSNAIEMMPDMNVIYNNGTNEIMHKVDLDFRGRILSVNSNSVIYTGGFPASKYACLLNLSTGGKNDMPLLNKERCGHAMIWIDGFPAVIGGNNGLDPLKETEIFKGDSWLQHSHLNVKRNNCSAISCLSNAYVFGGLEWKDYIIDNTIEKYEKGSWTLLKINLPTPLIAPGLIMSGRSILIFGGTGWPLKEENECAIFDDKMMRIKKIKPFIGKSAFFIQSIRVALNGNIFQYGFKDKDYHKIYNKLTSIY